jgi:hypothetical protein
MNIGPQIFKKKKKLAVEWLVRLFPTRKRPVRISARRPDILKVVYSYVPVRFPNSTLRAKPSPSFESILPNSSLLTRRIFVIRCHIQYLINNNIKSVRHSYLWKHHQFSLHHWFHTQKFNFQLGPNEFETFTGVWLPWPHWRSQRMLQYTKTCERCNGFSLK